MEKLGTVFATAKELAKMDAHSDREREQMKRCGDRIFGESVRYVEGGEYRWRTNDGRYAVIGRDGRPRYFERRADGDYASVR